MNYKEIMSTIDGLDEHTYNCMGKVIFGHEIWLGNAHSNLKTNEYSADLLYGHNMHSDGRAPKEYVNIVVLDAEGRAIGSKSEEINDGYRIHFKGNGNAPYTMYNETMPVIWNHINDGTWKAGVKRNFTNIKSSAAYQMYAKIVFSDEGPTRLEQALLEIIPDRYKLKVGEKASFRVLYEGRPLADKEIKFYSKESKEEIFAKTDGEGVASFDVNHEGDWMILMRYKDTSKAVDDEFDETVFIITLVMGTN